MKRRSGNEPLRVLAVDDSAVVREALKAVLGSAPDVVVEVAADASIALGKIHRRPPDVLVLDLQLPGIDGLTLLKRVMEEQPLPVVVCSAVAGKGSELALRALEAGAVEIVDKPRLDAKSAGESALLLLDAVRAAACARVAAPRRRPPQPPLSTSPLLGLRRRRRVVALGASTGGTEALERILSALPRDAPGVLVVQHMPAGFTAAFARRLDACARMEVREARHGDRVVPGVALIAPGDRHLRLASEGGELTVTLDAGPLVSRHRPSVDVLFRSVAAAAGAEAVGCVLTGMGDDGAQGLLELRQAGGATLAQDEASSVVFGMPKEAAARGAAEQVVPLERIPGAILRLVAA